MHCMKFASIERHVIRLSPYGGQELYQTKPFERGWPNLRRFEALRKWKTESEIVW